MSKNIPLINHFSDNRASASQQYQDLFVGQRGLWPLIKYELLVSLVSPVPGALGYWLRKTAFRQVLGACGRGSLFGRGLVLRNPGNIRIREQVIMDDLVVLDAKGEESELQIGSRVLISRGCSLSCHNSLISIGDSVSIAPFCYIASRSRVDIGPNVAIGSGTHILAGHHSSEDPETPIPEQSRISRGIVIEENAWIGSGARILDGVRVGKHSIVGAGAVVNKEVPDYGVVMGNPARMVKTRKPEQ